MWQISRMDLLSSGSSFRQSESRKPSFWLPLLSSLSHAAEEHWSQLSQVSQLGVDQRMSKVCPLRNISHKCPKRPN